MLVCGSMFVLNNRKVEFNVIYSYQLFEEIRIVSIFRIFSTTKNYLIIYKERGQLH